MLPLLNTCYATKLFTDLTVKVGDTEFLTSKSVLSSSCTYFSNLLRKNKKQNVLTVREVSADDFCFFLDFLHSGEKIEITDSNYKSLKNIYNSYEVETFQTIFEETLKTRPLFFVLTWFKHTRIEERDQSMLGIARLVVSESLDTDEILECDISFLLTILDEQMMGTLNQEKVFEFFMLWVNHKCCERNQHLLELMKSLNFDLIPFNYIHFNIIKCLQIQSNQEAFKYAQKHYFKRIEQGDTLKLDL